MNDVERVLLRDVATVISGFAFKSSEFGEAGIPVIKIANVRMGSVDLGECDHVATEYLSRLNPKFQVCGGDILISLTGSHVTQPNSVVGRVAKMPMTAPTCLLNQRAGKVIILDQQRCDGGYLYRYLTAASLKGEIASMASGAASQANVSPNQVGSLPVLLPSMESQRRIASILSAYDDLIENNTRRIAILEEMARRLYEEWFVHFRFPGHGGVRMVESEIGEVPEGWRITPVQQLLRHHIGGGWGKEEADSDHTDPAYVIRGTDIPTARAANPENCPLRYHKRSNLTARKLEAGDIVFEVSGGSHDQSVGRALFITKELLSIFDDEVICASFCKRLRVDDNSLISLLFYLHLRTIYDNKHIDQFQVQSTGIKNFQFKAFLEKEMVVIPPKPLQAKYFDSAGSILELGQVLGKQITNLRAQRDLLLPKLISGEIDVSKVPKLSEEVEAA